MTVTIPAELNLRGPRPLTGRLRVPGDKSLSHRALMVAAAARGRSRITGLADGADVASTAAVVRALGVHLRTAADGAVVVQGQGFSGWREAEGPLDCGNSGTTIRIMAGALAGRPFLSVLYGDESIAQRPMARIVEPLRQMGATVDARDDGRLPPIILRGGELRGIAYESPVASAQVKSCLLIAGLQATGETSVREPALSRDHTERMLAALGVPLVRDGLRVSVHAAEPEAFEYEVPGDPSAAAFFIVGACITPGSDLVVEAVDLNPTRIAFLDVLRRMGAAIDVDVTGERLGEPVGDIHVTPAPLQGTVMAGDEIPLIQDEIPVLAVAAAFADGVTDIRDAAELRVKESDRIGTVEQELSQLGVGVEARPDGLVIRGGRPRGALLKSHGDHRIAMACAIAANACDDTSNVRGWRAVASSYPGFADDLAQVTGA
jgi:3-phosphoshikimate 1-carboxyvinyltransferase